MNEVSGWIGGGFSAEVLPIYEVESEIMGAMGEGSRLVLTAPTGSGKSTQVPQMLLRRGGLGDGRIVVLQPRRLAARLLAGRVARECGTALGEGVGYQIRWENCSGPATRIKYVTEGVLLRQMVSDPQLCGVSVLIFDEFHERHLFGDVSLARAMDMQESTRPDLRVVVMSATLDCAPLSEYLRPCRVISSGGRQFPVEIRYAGRSAWEDRRPCWEQAADTFGDWVRGGGSGDVLIFMPGGYEIQQTLEALRRRRESSGYVVLPLHGELSPGDQEAAVACHDRPKIVVATNVAETSLTIEGIRVVIDSGLARIPRFDPHRGINTLWIEKISQAAADQRAGRAGRTASGVCLRLWTEAEHRDRPLQERSEVRRLDLSEVVLNLKATGIEDLRGFRWLEPPGEQRLAQAEELLQDLGALRRVEAGAEITTGEGERVPTRITELGRRMLAFPVHPRYARMLIAAAELGCVYDAIRLAALTQGRDLLLTKVDREVRRDREAVLGTCVASDLFFLMRAWEYAVERGFRVESCRRLGIHAQAARQVGLLVEQLVGIARREGLSVERGRIREDGLRKCLLAGFSDHVGRRLDASTLRCELVHGRRGTVARESVVPWCPVFVAAEVREIGHHGGEADLRVSLLTAIEPEWLESLFPEDMEWEVRTAYDSGGKRVVAESVQCFRGLVVASRRLESPPADAAARRLATEVLAGRLKLKHWGHVVEQWILRVNCLARWCPELGLPPIGEADRRLLVEQICHGAAGYREIKDRPVRPVVENWLNPAQQELLNRHAPERLTLSNGKSPKVTYVNDGDPYIAMRIQELYEVRSIPPVGLGKVSVLVHILAPNMRAVQVTRDLPGFWRDRYPRIKSELQRKYPKHEWR